jgi:hypothetical protein
MPELQELVNENLLIISLKVLRISIGKGKIQMKTINVVPFFEKSVSRCI